MTPKILFSSSFSKPFITEVTTIRLDIPIIRPIIAKKVVNEKDKREKFYKLTNEASTIMKDWAYNQNSIFSNVNDLIKK